MKQILLTSTAVVALSGAAFAQDAGAIQDAVDAGIEQLNQGGANITFDAREVGDDNSLTFRGVRIEPEDADFVITTEFVTLTPSTEVPGDVTVTVAPLVSFESTDDDMPLSVGMASENLQLTTNWVLGAAGKPQLSLSADSLNVTGGAEDHPFLKALSVAPEMLDFSMSFDEAARDVTGAFSMDGLKLVYDFIDPESSARMQGNMDTEKMTIDLTGTGLPEGEEDMDRFLSDGSFKLDIASGPSVQSFSSADPTMPMSLESEAESGTAQLSVENGEFLYRTDFGAVSYVVTPDPTALPLPPFDASLAGGMMELRTPVAPSDQVRDVKVGLALNELVLGESVWGMFDPQALLPREAANVALDLDAKLRLEKPLSEAPETDNPMEVGEVESVSLNKLLVQAAGAMVEADGAVTLDNTGPIPMPNGAVDINISGVQKLANSLVQLGLVDQMQVGMAMGMMMAFAQPAGEDAFTSKIEFKDGGIMANGQPLQ
ncbi:DUF2125 domain-containing protein [Halovulum sp. GXIMD14794]